MTDASIARDGAIEKYAEIRAARSEMYEARDALIANENSGSRKGRKPAIDRFADARDRYHALLRNDGVT